MIFFIRHFSLLRFGRCVSFFFKDFAGLTEYDWQNINYSNFKTKLENLTFCVCLVKYFVSRFIFFLICETCLVFQLTFQYFRNVAFQMTGGQLIEFHLTESVDRIFDQVIVFISNHHPLFSNVTYHLKSWHFNILET